MEQNNKVLHLKSAKKKKANGKVVTKMTTFNKEGCFVMTAELLPGLFLVHWNDSRSGLDATSPVELE